MTAAHDKITDLQLIRPAWAQVYLQGIGWRYDGQFREIESYWKSPDDRQHAVLPLRPEAGDYALRMSQLVESLADSESRSDQAVIRDLQTANMDIVSFRVNVDSGRDGTMPLKEGVGLFKSARDALSAAARAARETRPLFQGNTPGEVGRYLKKVRMGQTEHGSYVVNLLSPIAAPLNQTPNSGERLFADRGYDSEIYFPRSVTVMLRKALRSTQEAKEKSEHDTTYQAFVNSVPSGVSANLCEALLRIQESVEGGKTQVNLRWAYTLPEGDQQYETFNFDSSYVPILREAAVVLREIDPYENYLLQGKVVGLRRDALLEAGRVIVKTRIEDRERHVTVDLANSDYDSAVAAHKADEMVGVWGRLQNKHAQWFLENPRDFSVYRQERLSRGEEAQSPP